MGSRDGMLFRLFFPEICFSGRLSRSAFWREIALSIMWAPIAYATFRFLMQEAAVVTEGVAGSGIRLQGLVGIALFALGARNTLAMVGVIKRRMNDRGHRAGLMKHLWPVGAIAVLTPFSFVLPLAAMAIPILTLLQIFIFMRGTSDLFLGPSYDSPEYAGPIRTFDNNMIERILKTEVNRLGPQLEHLAGSLRERWADIQVQARENLSEPAAAGAARKRPRPAKQPKPARKPKYETAHARKTATVARASRPSPRNGRSRMIDGLIAGPWG